MAKVWSFIKGAGFMAFLALVGFVLSIYLGFFYDKKPHLVYTVSQPTKVFDIHQALGGLEISYAGESLRGGQKTLWVMTVILKNEGNAEVTKGDYDDRDPLGVSVKNGQLLEQPTFQSDSSYISKNLGMTREANSVHFAPIIIEPGDSLSISMLVLGTETTKPEIIPTGKIAGASALEVRSAEDKTQTGIFKDLFYSERWWIQGLRGPVYALLFMIGGGIIAVLVQALIIPFEIMKDKKEKNLRHAKVARYRLGQPLSAAERVFTKLYDEQGFRPILNAYHALAEVCTHQIDLDRIKHALEPKQVTLMKLKYFSVSSQTDSEIQKLEDHGLSGVRSMSMEQVTTILREIEGLASHLQEALQPPPRQFARLTHRSSPPDRMFYDLEPPLPPDQ